ncbi:MAG: M24 family metallopeptidase [bacterium]
MQENLPKIREAVAASACDALLITSEQNRFYATGFPSSAGTIAVTPEEAVLFIDSRYFEEASARIRTAQVVELKNRAGLTDALAALFQKRGVKTLGVEADSMSHSQFAALQEKLPVTLVNGQPILTKLRAVKSPEELQLLRNAQAIADKSFRALLPLLKRGMTERDVAVELLCLMLRNGADDKAFDTISVNALHSSSPHGHPDGRLLEPGFLTIDFGARKDGYNSDTTRTVCLGAPTAEMEKVYSTVLQAQLAVIDAAKAGVAGKELDGLARRIIAEAGYDGYFSHSLSHGLGIDVHESPYCSTLSPDILAAGNVISDEPGIYIPGKFGVRIEDCLIIREDGCENLCTLPKELLVIDF